MGDQKSLCKGDDHGAKSQRRMEFNQANYVGWDLADRRTAVCAKTLIKEKEWKIGDSYK